MSSVKDGDWEGTLRDLTSREKEVGGTHYLIVQREADRIAYAAMIPIGRLLPIWCAQRDASAMLIRGRRTRRTKNHAMNGSSPTLWLHDDGAPAVHEALWDDPEVRDLASLSLTARFGIADAGRDDTFADLPIAEDRSFGSDEPALMLGMRSYVRRDPRVRRAVIKRAGGRCERPGCRTRCRYLGFLDVHYVLGAAKSDRVSNCVGICPNCHREAHVAPPSEASALNEVLLDVAQKARAKHLGR
jgi:5-methylcytosine-specific restriction protein A